MRWTMVRDTLTGNAALMSQPKRWRMKMNTFLKSAAVAAMSVAMLTSTQVASAQNEEISQSLASIITYFDVCEVNPVITNKQRNEATTAWYRYPKAAQEKARASIDELIKQNGGLSWFCNRVSELAQQNSPAGMLKMTALKIESSARSSWTYAMLQVENLSAITYSTTEWSCVLTWKSEPVFEKRFYVSAVSANSKTIQRQIFDYDKGPVDGIDCRLLDAR